MSLLEHKTYFTIKFPLYRTRHEIPYMQFVMHLKQESPHNASQKELCSIKDHIKCLNNYELLKEN